MLKVCNISKRFYSSGPVAGRNWQSLNHKFNQKIKGTFLEKWVNFWKLVARDYREVAINVRKDIKEKPLKAAVYFSVSAFVGLCIELNPDLQSFRSKYVQSANDVSLVPLNLANPQAIDHLNYIERCFNRQLIRHTNLGLFSIIWVDKFSKECDTYECKCTYLQVPYWGVPSRILDIGFLNVWWITSRKMLDYDINY